MSTHLKVGVIGLGQMGRPMAANLVKRGFDTHGFDVNAAALAAAEPAGVRPARSIREVLAASDIVLLSLPTEEILRQVVTGEGGLIAAGVAGKVVLDTTTTTVVVAQQMAAAVAAAGGTFVDAPVTGGAVGAEAATLTFMIGADAEGLARVQPVLAAMGRLLVHVGPSGHGQAAKMVNQMLMAAIYVSVAESFTFAAQLGVDVGQVYAAVENGGGQSRLLQNIKAGLLAGQTRTNGNIDQHGKDIDYVMQEANRRHLHLPLTASVHEFYNLSRSLGFGHLWSGDMWAVWEKVLGVDLSATIKTPPPPP